MNIQIFGTSKCFDTKKAQRLPPPAALQPGVFFRGDIMFCHGFLSPKVLLLTFSIPQGSAECKTLPMVFL